MLKHVRREEDYSDVVGEEWSCICNFIWRFSIEQVEDRNGASPYYFLAEKN